MIQYKNTRLPLILCVILFFAFQNSNLFAQNRNQQNHKDTSYVESNGITVKKSFFNNGNVQSIERTKEGLKEGR